MQGLLLSTGIAASLALISLGGGLFEYRVIDPAWPTNPTLIQPRNGGVDRKRFWIPAHIMFELTLISALVLAWGTADVRFWLLIGLASHFVMRLWSALYFIPKALAFEKSEPKEMSLADAKRWTRRSLARLPLDLVTCMSMLAAFAAACRATSG
jgi:hypothetical protein